MTSSGHAALRPASLAFLLAAASLCGCSLFPKPDGIAIDHPSGLDGISKAFGIEALDPTVSVPLIEQTFEELRKTDPHHRLQGATYDLSAGNTLGTGWLIQSPNVWDRRAADVPVEPTGCRGCEADLQLPACSTAAPCAIGHCTALQVSTTRAGQSQRSFCLGHSDALIERFYAPIARARHAVDITLLQPAPDARFLAGLRNAISAIAASGRHVTVRILIGSYPPAGVDALAFIRDLVSDAAYTRGSHLRLFVGTTRSCNNDETCEGLSWNHAKVVAVDGQRAIVGGHNMWTGDYLGDAPVHDVSIELSGPAARNAHRFADALWAYVCARPGTDDLNVAYRFVPHEGLKKACLASMRLPHLAHTGKGASVLAIGRLGKGITTTFADQSLIARTLLLGAARHSIRMIQQDVAFALNGIDPIWPDAVLERISDLITERDGDAYIVLSNVGAAGAVGRYSYGVRLETVADRIIEVAAQRSHMGHRQLVELMCRHLHLAPLRFGPDQTWPGKRAIAVHAKFWMVDDRVFYIGSENLYPANLQELGYVVEDSTAARQARTDLWDRAWRWSQTAAISGSEAHACVFRQDAFQTASYGRK